MANNQFNIKRTAFANFSTPSGVTNAVRTVVTDAWIPTGAIITGIRFFAAAAFIGAATFGAATINAAVGAVVIGSNELGVTQAILQTVAVSNSVVNDNGLLIKTGAFLALHFGTSNGTSTGVTADADIYVDYLYCPARDLS